jgi:hypothetical protein
LYISRTTISIYAFIEVKTHESISFHSHFSHFVSLMLVGGNFHLENIN